MSGGAGRVRRVMLLGSTGSIGTQTLEVLSNLNALHARGLASTRYEVVGLAAGRNAAALFAQAAALGVREVAVCAPGRVDAPPGMNVRVGEHACEALVREVECDVVLGAVVGFAGLPATLAAVEQGRDVALANKETLVAAGSIVVDAARRSGSRLLPVDSEHSAVWQCLPDLVPPCRYGPEVSRVVLTASGGPFRGASAREVYDATPERALNHPTWSMGAKVTIDSASLTNKALELIEAHWLFGLESARLDAVVHPQSIVHSFVEFADGSVLAQCGAPDMRTPIQYALTHPERPGGCSKRIDWATLGRLDFEPVDHERFPALRVAHEVIRSGGDGATTAGAVFNGANEAAVGAFLRGEIAFGRITELAREALTRVGVSALRTLDDAREADGEARRFVEREGGGGKASRHQGIEASRGKE